MSNAPYVSIDDPLNIRAQEPPIYEGELSGAGQRLIDGDYPAQLAPSNPDDDWVTGTVHLVGSRARFEPDTEAS